MSISEARRAYGREYRANNKEAIRASEQEYRDKNKEKIKLCQAEWRAKNPEKVKSYRLRHSYGLTQQAFDDMFTAQQGQCAVCSRRMVKACVDHCHKTGVVRALLCSMCNTSLGGFQDDPELTDKATQYLKKHAEN